MPGGLGAQLGLPWFGTGLIGALLFVEIVVELFVLLVLVLLLLLVSRLLTEPPFPNSDDLFGATDRFKPFVGGGGGVAGTLAIELLELIKRNRLCYVCAYRRRIPQTWICHQTYLLLCDFCCCCLNK